ncbi:MAG: S1C family serine protease [Thermoleophilia bacterium]
MVGMFGRSFGLPDGPRHRLRPVWSLIAVVALVTLTILVSVGCADLAVKEAETGNTTSSAESGVTTTTSSEGPIAGSAEGLGVSPAIAVAEAVGPSVVNVGVTGSVPGVFGTQNYSGEGSGVIFSSDGMIVTNNHVVSQESGGREFLADQITVTLETGEKLPATVVGTDPITDLAVLKVEKTGLPAATFIDDFSKVRIGQYAVAIGSPLGLENSVTMGIISGVQRELEVAPGVQQFSLVDLVQTDAAISPGNSGGALVDVQGNVIGINVAYLPPGQTGAQNVGFAIPADLVVDVARQIIDTGRAHHAYLGVQNVSVTDALQQRFSLSRSSGVLVAGTDPGTPAADAGLKQGDIIIQLDGQKVEGDSDLFSILRRKKPGDVVSLTFDRAGKESTVQVTLGERPQ